MCPGTSAWCHGQKGGSGGRCMGRSRGGLTTKIHALVDADGLPIRLQLTAGQRHDGVVAEEMLDGLCDGGILLADKAYDADAIRYDKSPDNFLAAVMLASVRIWIKSYESTA